MRFSRMLASIALALSIALGSSVAAVAVPSTPSTTPPVEAPQNEACLTPDIVVQGIIAQYPNTDIKDVSSEPPYSITFTNPDQDTDLVAHFDNDLCFTDFVTQSKVQA